LSILTALGAFAGAVCAQPWLTDSAKAIKKYRIRLFNLLN